MRAAILTEYGATPQVGDFDDPVASAGSAVVEVRTAGLNPVDLRKTAGGFYAGDPPLPSVVGSEGIATLDGRRVYFDASVAPYGSFGERTLIDPAIAFDVPDGVEDAVALGLGIAGLAGWMALETRAQLRAGEHVLVLGASGTVGQIAVQAARLLGAGRVVAAARSEERLERARELGADATVVLGGDGDLAEAFREAAGGGVDVIVDPLWGAPALAALAAADPGARLVQLGQSAGATAEVASATVRGRGLSILGFSVFGAAVAERRAAYARMAAHAAAGELAVDVETVSLDDVAEAWERQKGSPHRKLVIVP